MKLAAQRGLAQIGMLGDVYDPKNLDSQGLAPTPKDANVLGSAATRGTVVRSAGSDLEWLSHGEVRLGNYRIARGMASSAKQAIVG